MTHEGTLLVSQLLYLADGFWPAHEMWSDTDGVGQVAEAERNGCQA